MMTAPAITAALACARPGCECDRATRKGSGDTHCPAHEDGQPSLSVSERSGVTLVHCQAGCAQDAVIAALVERGLWGSPPGRNGHATSRPVVPTRTKDYQIKDATGHVVAIHRRIEQTNGKTFAWLGPDGSTGLNGTPSVELPLYRTERLQGLPPGAPAVLVEGEKAADALGRMLQGHRVAVLGTVTGAASTPSDEVLGALVGRRVVLWPDNDEPGQQHMRKIAARLVALGCKQVVTVKWPQAPEHGDAADFVANHSLEELAALLKAAEPFKGEALPAVQPAVEGLLPVAGDHLNAEHFLAAYGDKVLWVPQLREWFVWNGAWWEQDKGERVPEMARKTIDGLRQWAAEAGTSPDEFKRRASHYTSSTKGGRTEALLQVARTQEGVVATVEQLDADPYALACRNGTVDLRAGALRPANPKDLITRGVAVDYDPAARSKLWDDFLATTFCGDSELVAYVQRLMGYSSTGVVSEHIAPVFHGSGANGKSTFVGAIQDLLGEAARPAPEGLLTETGSMHPHPERIADLRGRRLVVTFELEQRVTLAEGLVKTLTGGDRLSAREIMGRRFDFAPTHKLLIVTNHKPRVRGTDESIWRRLRLVPFSHTVTESEKVDGLREKLVKDHGPAILAWLVAGAVAWARDGLGTAKAVTLATASYRADQDLVSQFLSETVKEVPGERVKVGDLWALWQSWAAAANERPGRKQDFALALVEHGLELETYQGAKFVRGRDLISNPPSREVSLGLDVTMPMGMNLKTLTSRPHETSPTASETPPTGSEDSSTEADQTAASSPLPEPLPRQESVTSAPPNGHQPPAVALALKHFPGATARSSTRGSEPPGPDEDGLPAEWVSGYPA
jgi:putative DNA primase/helicase